MLSENKDYEFGSTSEALITILKKLKEFEGRLTLIDQWPLNENRDGGKRNRHQGGGRRRRQGFPDLNGDSTVCHLRETEVDEAWNWAVFADSLPARWISEERACMRAAYMREPRADLAQDG